MVSSTLPGFQKRTTNQRNERYPHYPTPEYPAQNGSNNRVSFRPHSFIGKQTLYGTLNPIHFCKAAFRFFLYSLRERQEGFRFFSENLLRLLDFLYRLEDSIDGELVDGVADFRQGLVENIVDVRCVLLGFRVLGEHIAKLRKAGDAAFFDGAGNSGRG